MGDPSIARSTRTYVLATLLATVAVTALIGMLFVILCPAQVTFMVTHACRSNSSNDSTVSLHLSIFTNTSQRRTKVKFESIFIDLFDSSYNLPLGREEEDDWRRRINAHVDDHEMPDGYLKYPGNKTIAVSAATPKHTFLDFAPDWLTDDVGQALTVMVMAQVHFKIGVVRTRLYGITVYCNGVVFPNQPTTTTTAPWCTAKNDAPPVSDTVNKFLPVTCHN